MCVCSLSLIVTDNVCRVSKALAAACIFTAFAERYEAVCMCFITTHKLCLSKCSGQVIGHGQLGLINAGMLNMVVPGAGIF